MHLILQCSIILLKYLIIKTLIFKKKTYPLSYIVSNKIWQKLKILYLCKFKFIYYKLHQYTLIDKYKKITRASMKLDMWIINNLTTKLNLNTKKVIIICPELDGPLHTVWL